MRILTFPSLLEVHAAIEADIVQAALRQGPDKCHDRHRAGAFQRIRFIVDLSGLSVTGRPQIIAWRALLHAFSGRQCEAVTKRTAPSDTSLYFDIHNSPAGSLLGIAPHQVVSI
jgi:hypothetical protein